jgi:large subunit ribosomal protein L18
MTTSIKQQKRQTRHRRVRAKVSGTSERPRLSVYKSNTRLVAQLIDDMKGVTLAAVSSAEEKGKTPRERAEAAASTLAKRWGEGRESGRLRPRRLPVHRYHQSIRRRRPRRGIAILISY